jgi:hypothetical protein
VQDIADYFGLALVGGEDFNGPVWCVGEASLYENRECIGDFAAGVTGNAFPGEDGEIGDDRSASEGTAQFGIGSGNMTLV